MEYDVYVGKKKRKSDSIRKKIGKSDFTESYYLFLERSFSPFYKCSTFMMIHCTKDEGIWIDRMKGLTPQEISLAYQKEMFWIYPTDDAFRSIDDEENVLYDKVKKAYTEIEIALQKFDESPSSRAKEKMSEKHSERYELIRAMCQLNLRGAMVAINNVFTDEKEINF